jgi:hypothetical protein
VQRTIDCSPVLLPSLYQFNDREFLPIAMDEAAEHSSLRFVVNWFPELESRMCTDSRKVSCSGSPPKGVYVEVASAVPGGRAPNLEES